MSLFNQFAEGFNYLSAMVILKYVLKFDTLKTDFIGMLIGYNYNKTTPFIKLF